MATETSLTSADAEDVAAARETVVAYLEQQYPDLSVRAGPLADLVVGPSVDALTAVRVYSEAAVTALDPETALATGGYDEDVLNAALAARGVTRESAARASGSIAVHVTSPTGVTVPSGYTVTAADGTAYVTSGAKRLLAPGSTASSAYEVVTVAVPSGGYAAVVAVSAVGSGAAGNKPAGTALTATAAISGQTAVYAATDLSGGADLESDADLLARLPAATVPRTVSSWSGAAAVVYDAVPDYSDAVAVGFGHQGMLRGRSALTGQTPGRMDLRVRTGSSPSRVRVPVTATLIATAPFGQWRFTLGVDDAPGRFLVEKVVQRNNALSASGYAPTALTAGYDLDADPVGVDVRTSADAAQSRYATLAVTFTDPDTSTSGMTVNVTTRSYDAVVRTIAGLDTAQDAVDAEGARSTGGDCLVRSACPVMVSVTAAATVQAGVTLDADEVSAAVARAINANGIGTVLYGSVVAARAVSYLPPGTALQLSGWEGIVYSTHADPDDISGTTGLNVTTDWTSGLGDGTVAYYADETDVTSTVASL